MEHKAKLYTSFEKNCKHSKILKKKKQQIVWSIQSMKDLEGVGFHYDFLVCTNWGVGGGKIS